MDTFLVSVIKKLDKHCIDYRITMGLAINFYAPERKFNDIDILICRENMLKAADIFKKKLTVLNTEFGPNECLLLGKKIEISCFDMIDINGKRINLGLSDCRNMDYRIRFIENYPAKIICPEFLFIQKFFLKEVRKKDEKDINLLLKSPFFNSRKALDLANKYFIGSQVEHFINLKNQKSFSKQLFNLFEKVKVLVTGNN